MGVSMNYQKFKEIVSQFSYNDVKEFLGDKLYNCIIEWSDSDSSYSHGRLVDILVSINGFGLFSKRQFRNRFFQSVPLRDLQYLLNSNDSNYGRLAKIASSIDFNNNDFYRKLFSDVLGCADYEFDDDNMESRHTILDGTSEKFFELLDYQYLIKQQTLYELEYKSDIGRRVLIHMPTGTGKTKTAMHILTHYLNFLRNDGIVLWVAHTNELLGQALSTFEQVWGHLGLSSISIEKSWGQGEYLIDQGVVFITIQALQSLKKSRAAQYEELRKKTCLVIYDECHKIGAFETKKIVKDFSQSEIGKRRDFIGLTATPGRTTEYSGENQLFSEFFDRIIRIDTDLVNRINMGPNSAINAETVTDIISYFQKRRILSRLIKQPLTYSVDTEIQEKIEQELKYNREDFSKSLVTKIANNKARNTVILNKLKELNKAGVPTIVFACSLDHAKMLSAFLNLENIPNSLVHSELSRAARKRAISDFKDRNSSVNIIINFDILTTGFDSTNIDCVFITRPTKSVILYSQMIGRGLRGPQMGGSETCLLIDVQENIKAYDENSAFAHFNSYWR